MSPMMRRCRGRKGQALAEFALVLPVLFLLIAGIIELGRGWNIKQALTDAAREGARYTVIADDAVAHDSAFVRSKIRERLSLAHLATTDPPTTITIDPMASYKCPGGVGSGDEMTVTVATQYKMAWVGVLMGWAGVPSTITISSQATMRNEC
jgi:Flp pilus assembly protein TadG